MLRDLYLQEKPIADRLREFRVSLYISQAALADRIGCTRSMLASYEACQEPLSWGVFLAINEAFALDAHWLATGEGMPTAFGKPPEFPRSIPVATPFSAAFAEHRATLSSGLAVREPTRLKDDIETLIGNLSTFAGSDEETRSLALDPLVVKHAGDLYELLGGWLVRAGELIAKQARARHGFATPQRIISGVETSLRNGDGHDKSNARSYRFGHMDGIDENGIPIDLEALLSEVRERTKAPGAKSALAKMLGIPQQRLSQWLGNNGKPSGKQTLALLRWIASRGPITQP
jgi:transcriptional regulator with XRE-family HTH domain